MNEIPKPKLTALISKFALETAIDWLKIDPYDFIGKCVEAGLDRRTISGALNGEKTIRKSTIIDICRIFNINEEKWREFATIAKGKLDDTIYAYNLGFEEAYECMENQIRKLSEKDGKFAYLTSTYSEHHDLPPRNNVINTYLKITLLKLIKERSDVEFKRIINIPNREKWNEVKAFILNCEKEELKNISIHTLIKIVNVDKNYSPIIYDIITGISYSSVQVIGKNKIFHIGIERDSTSCFYLDKQNGSDFFVQKYKAAWENTLPLLECGIKNACCDRTFKLIDRFFEENERAMRLEPIMSFEMLPILK